MESCIAWDSKYDPLSMKFRLVYMELFAWEGEICHERFVNRSFGGSTWNHVYGDNRLGTCYRKWKTIHFNSIWFKLCCTVRPYTAPWKLDYTFILDESIFYSNSTKFKRNAFIYSIENIVYTFPYYTDLLESRTVFDSTIMEHGRDYREVKWWHDWHNGKSIGKMCTRAF